MSLHRLLRYAVLISAMAGTDPHTGYTVSGIDLRDFRYRHTHLPNNVRYWPRHSVGVLLRMLEEDPLLMCAFAMRCPCAVLTYGSATQCPVGVLLRMLEEDPLLSGVTHVLVDEVRSEHAAVYGDGAAVYGDDAAVNGDCAAVNGDDAAVNGDCAAVNGDCAAVYGDCAAVYGDCAAVYGDGERAHGDN
eukprot:1270097-Rhodomonas_salina.1